MTDAADYEQLRDFRPDSVVFLNVLEHLEDDRAVLADLFETMPPAAASSCSCPTT